MKKLKTFRLAADALDKQFFLAFLAKDAGLI